MTLQGLKRIGSEDYAWTCDPETGLFTRNNAVVDAGQLDFSFNANVNDLNESALPGISETFRVRLNPQSNNLYIAGMAAGVAGQKRWLSNVHASNRVQFFNGAVAPAANQWSTPRTLPFYLYPGQEMETIYDGDLDKWRCLLSFSTSVALPVAVPALATSERGHVDVNIGGTFNGLGPGDAILVNPVSDEAPDGAGNGGLINAYMVSANTCRLVFVGATPAAAVSFLFTYPF